MKARIYKILKQTRVEGPGVRYCIWFQGCSKHCSGCWAKATWDSNGGYEIDVRDILNDILNTKTIEGVTFLGGEPFEQYDAIRFLAENIKAASLSVLCFTGKSFKEIKENFSDILPYIDLLIDGEFKEEEKDYSRPWVGSKNQNYYFLSDRYNEEMVMQYKNKIEINVQKNGLIFINGMGDFEKFVQNLKMPNTH